MGFKVFKLIGNRYMSFYHGLGMFIYNVCAVIVCAILVYKMIKYWERQQKRKEHMEYLFKKKSWEEDKD